MDKILLVEDDYTLGSILKDQLEMNGYEVTLLTVPAQTVDTLSEGEFDLLILDKLLRGIDGTELCADIRRIVGISEIPILMMSGFDDASRECLAAGANNFIAKPFAVDSFLQSIDATLRVK